ncbi:MAG TPA: O-methyltransferase [Acidimicrobiales bacterium]|nr:O-methyltransferase [Acidimicrobiales bacterium]
MTQAQWTAVDDYLTGLLFPADDALDRALQDAAAGGLPPINVTAAQGRLLHILARAQGARTILEVGTLGGFSTIWLARALPDGGRLVTLEIDPHHAEVARANIDRAGLADRVDIRVGPALETLPTLADEGFGPVDFVFIDADKQRNTAYFEWAVRLGRVGTTIVVDNVIRDGHVVDAGSDDPSVQGVRRFNEVLAAERRVTATEIQTVGSKGYDGFAIALVTG